MLIVDVGEATGQALVASPHEAHVRWLRAVRAEHDRRVESGEAVNDLPPLLVRQKAGDLLQ